MISERSETKKTSINLFLAKILVEIIVLIF